MKSVQSTSEVSGIFEEAVYSGKREKWGPPKSPGNHGDLGDFCKNVSCSWSPFSR